MAKNHPEAWNMDRPHLAGFSPPWPTEVSATKTIGSRFAGAGVVRAVCHSRSPAVGIVREAVKAVGDTVAVTITVPLVRDAIAVKIAVRTIKACLAPLVA